MNRIKVSKADKAIKTIVEACYPEWRGRKIFVWAKTSYNVSNYWSEGSRNYVVAYHLSTGQTSQTSTLATNPMNLAAHAEVEIPDGVVLVEHSIFCGKDVGVTIYANPANVPKFLAASPSS